MTDYNNWVHIEKDKAHIKKEKAKAVQLRKTNWWQSLLSKGICYYCKNEFAPSELTMDHVVPLSRGGKSTKGNIVPCCKECNNEKKYYTPVDMILNELDQNDNK
ncbi:MAG: HNH endonuclease [bacterium]|nr:HNH endonuclease [bacterium]